MSGGRYPNEQSFFVSRQKLQAKHEEERDHTNRAILDSQMAKLDMFDNPRGLPRHIVSALVSADRCAKCLGELDTGWECNDCGYDWKPWMDASRAAYDAAHDRREG